MSVRRLMRQTVTIEPLTGEGARGPLYGPAVKVRARVEEGADYREGDAERHEVTSATTVYLPYETNCPERSRITLPSGEVGIAAKVTRHAGRPAIRHLRVAVR